MMKNHTPLLKRVSLAAWSGVILIALSLVALEGHIPLAIFSAYEIGASGPSTPSKPSNLSNLLVVERVVGAERDLDVLGTLCRDGHAESCWYLGTRMDHSSSEEAAPWFSKGCRLGDIRSCEKAISVSREPSIVKNAIEILRNRCELGNESASCRSLAKSFDELGFKDRATEFADKACAKGSANSCLDLALLRFERSEQAPLALEDIKRFCTMNEAAEKSSVKKLCLEMQNLTTVTRQTVRRFFKASHAVDQARLDDDRSPAVSRSL